ncbi:hypothetical protein B0T24DRAFT_249764 [Lasiosphaeria ovina]|uniref:Rhodopsin domain-containing protein n=1 Tax=Lasiosphaeria ovina TaxID=92902 RepID=A0AAE0N889_9PEZI|nr:hypothetical protein B0T24DRAFT_249764 [Lasiosphaeria ovina]
MDANKLPASDNKGPTLLASVFALYAIALIVYVVRVWSRLSPKFALTAADYAITVSLLAKCASIGLTTAAVQYGFGRHAIYIPLADQSMIGKLTFATFIVSIISSGFARISIASLLLQVTAKRWWRVAIWATIVLQAIIMILYCVVQLAQCQSVISNKINIKQSQCLMPSHVWSFSYAYISLSMFGDIVCAVIPIFLIRSLTRSLIEKVLTSILLASCLLASGIAIAKLYFMITFDFSSPDGFYLMVDEFFWSRMEESVIIIAACAPLLRVPIERLLVRLGMPGFQIPARDLSTISVTPTIKESASGSGSDSRRSEREYAV